MLFFFVVGRHRVAWFATAQFWGIVVGPTGALRGLTDTLGSLSRRWHGVKLC